MSTIAGRTLYTARIKFNNFTPPQLNCKTPHFFALVKVSTDTFVQRASISFTNCSGIALVNPMAPSINGVARIYCQFVFNDRGNKRNLINNNWVGHISCSTFKIGFPVAVFYCFATRKQGFGPILTENWAECPNFWAGTKVGWEDKSGVGKALHPSSQHPPS